jgi:probable HAF family extracellular repeat protein
MGGDRAFLWNRTNGIRNLAASGILSGSGQSSANDINDLGQIVGNSEIGAFIWEKGVTSNLNNLINVNSGWTLTSAEAINEQGYIVGYGNFNGKTRAFLLKPQQQIPELTTFVGLLAFSALAINQKQRFKSKYKI